MTRRLTRCSCRVCVSVSGVLFSVGVCVLCVDPRSSLQDEGGDEDAEH